MQQSNTQRFHFSEKQSNNKKVKVKSLSRVRLLATPWTVAYQAPQSMGFSSKSTGVGCHFRLQGIFTTQRLNLGLPYCRQMLYRLGQDPTIIVYTPLVVVWTKEKIRKD